jgi:transposase
VGYDAAKKIKGRKIHPLVDVEGLPLRIVVHSAGIQDRDGAALVLNKIRESFPGLELVWADGGYNAHQVQAVAAANPGLRVEIVKRSDDVKGFVVLPRRWVVERTFSRVSDEIAASLRIMKTSLRPLRPLSRWPQSSSVSEDSRGGSF